MVDNNLMPKEMFTEYIQELLDDIEDEVEHSEDEFNPCAELYLKRMDLEKVAQFGGPSPEHVNACTIGMWRNADGDYCSYEQAALASPLFIQMGSNDLMIARERFGDYKWIAAVVTAEVLHVVLTLHNMFDANKALDTSGLHSGCTVDSCGLEVDHLPIDDMAESEGSNAMDFLRNKLRNLGEI